MHLKKQIFRIHYIVFVIQETARQTYSLSENLLFLGNANAASGSSFKLLPSHSAGLNKLEWLHALISTSMLPSRLIKRPPQRDIKGTSFFALSTYVLQGWSHMWVMSSRARSRLLDHNSITGLGKIVVPRLRELASRCRREPGGGIHATSGELFCPALYVHPHLPPFCEKRKSTVPGTFFPPPP